MESLERDECKSLIEKYGGRVTGSVNSKTNYLLVGRDGGESKLEKARSLKVKIISEDDLLQMITTRSGDDETPKKVFISESQEKPPPSPTKSKPILLNKIDVVNKAKTSLSTPPETDNNTSTRSKLPYDESTLMCRMLYKQKQHFIHTNEF